jgi:hypothetical protein
MAEHTAVEVSVLEREHATIVADSATISAKCRLRDTAREVRAFIRWWRADAFAGNRSRRRALQLVVGFFTEASD